MDKHLIKKSFRKCIPSYDQHAMVQQHICTQLMDWIDPALYFQKVYEIGTGTGFLTKLLIERLQIKEYVANDLVEEIKPVIEEIMKNAMFHNGSFQSGDAETMDIPANCDLIISGSTLQWFHDPDLFFKKMQAKMMKDGLVVFNTFGKQNFHESTAITGNGLNYMEKTEMEFMLSKYFEVQQSSEDIIRLKLNDPVDVLQHFKKTGVNGLTCKKWTKSMLAQYIQIYRDRFPFENGVSLTYHPMYFVARKK